MPSLFVEPSSRVIRLGNWKTPADASAKYHNVKDAMQCSSVESRHHGLAGVFIIFITESQTNLFWKIQFCLTSLFLSPIA